MKLLRLCCLALPLFALTAYADVLGSADAFGVLGASAVTNTGPSVIWGDLGVYPGTSITGFPPGIVHGSIHNDDAVAMQAQADALTGYNFLAGLSFNQNLTGQDLGGKTLDAGVYFFSSSAQLTGAPEQATRSADCQKFHLNENWNTRGPYSALMICNCLKPDSGTR